MTPDKSEKAKALALALSHIERQFGRGSLMRLGAAGAVAEVAVIPTGSLALDAALGVGGIPRGRVTEIYGSEASGKTTLALHVIQASKRWTLWKCSSAVVRSTSLWWIRWQRLCRKQNLRVIWEMPPWVHRHA